MSAIGSAAARRCDGTRTIGVRRVLIAPDKFKGTLTGEQAAGAMARGVHEAIPGAEVRTVVVADGGEGTLEAAVSNGAELVRTTVSGPLGDPVEAQWAMLDGTAIIELASASGLQLTEPSPASALRASTDGTGQLIRAALDASPERIVVGVGGAASTDGGMGLLRALGVRFLDVNGTPLSGGGGELCRLAAVDLDHLDERLATTPITTICDVAVPLLGPSGAAVLFSRQKGADARAQRCLGAGLEALARCLNQATGRDVAAIAWGGAAGGTAGGMYAALGAQFEPGIDFVAEMIGLEAHLRWADLVITGEGSLDHQSLNGKAPIGVVQRATAASKPVVVVAGRIRLDNDLLRDLGVHAWCAAESVAPAAVDAVGRDAAAWVSQATQVAMSDFMYDISA